MKIKIIKFYYLFISIFILLSLILSQNENNNSFVNCTYQLYQKKDNKWNSLKAGNYFYYYLVFTKEYGLISFKLERQDISDSNRISIKLFPKNENQSIDYTINFDSHIEGNNNNNNKNNVDDNNEDQTTLFYTVCFKDIVEFTIKNKNWVSDLKLEIMELSDIYNNNNCLNDCGIIQSSPNRNKNTNSNINANDKVSSSSSGGGGGTNSGSLVCIDERNKNLNINLESYKSIATKNTALTMVALFIFFISSLIYLL